MTFPMRSISVGGTPSRWCSVEDREKFLLKKIDVWRASRTELAYGAMRGADQQKRLSSSGDDPIDGGKEKKEKSYG
jgi:hypothetical protein